MNRTISILLVLASAWCARAVTFEWDASPDQWVTGYRLYTHTNSMAAGTNLTTAIVRIDAGTNLTTTVTNLTTAVVKIDAGTNLTATVTNLAPGRYYFVATAYTADNLESPPSNEIILSVPVQPPNLRTVVVQWSGLVASTNWQDAVFFKFKIP